MLSVVFIGGGQHCGKENNKDSLSVNSHSLNPNVNARLRKLYSLNSFSLKLLSYKQREDMLSVSEVLLRVDLDFCFVESW